MWDQSDQSDSFPMLVMAITSNQCYFTRFMNMPELLSPAGSWDCLRAAVANGADAVYFGLSKFNARLRADNFTEADLPAVVEFCHSHGVKAYVTLNTLVFSNELELAADYLRLLNREKVDAVIVQDLGIATLARELVPDLPIHASTQMTLSSREGIDFVRELGIRRVILARELSICEIGQIGGHIANGEGGQSAASVCGDAGPELEVFVHGALCVAYSGQCLTSESLGQRSANRGECAQACRMPYELIVDDVPRDLGDRRYLLSPQDLAGVNEIPALLDCGVAAFKIEGRLKSPEYVAAVTQVYRKAIDAAIAERSELPGRLERAGDADAKTGSNLLAPEDRYRLEMTFSRGLYSGWLHGVNHQRLVAARFGKKRGPFAGVIARIGSDFVEFDAQVAMKPGDGIVFDTGGDPDHEQGGRIFEIKGRRYFFKHGHLDFKKLKAGDRIWKTDDPGLNGDLRKSFVGRIPARHEEPVDFVVSGKAGEPLLIEASWKAGEGEAVVSARSMIPLQAARTAPLTTEKLREHLGKLGGSCYRLRGLTNELEGDVILPIGELNRLRREVVAGLDEKAHPARPETGVTVRGILTGLGDSGERSGLGPPPTANSLSVLCRTMEQIEAALGCGVQNVYADFEDLSHYPQAVALVRGKSGVRIGLATPRIQKPGETRLFKLIANAGADGVLIRSLGAMEFFAGGFRLGKIPDGANGRLELIGDFSLNVANPITAGFLIRRGLDRLTISYDLNIGEVIALLEQAPPDWFELTIHQHMPMFYMDHCVFAAFLSEGTDHTNCGRPCDRHRLQLRDRVGVRHPVHADAGCRNTMFNAQAQTGASFFHDLQEAGLRRYRLELLDESFTDSSRVIAAYQTLLSGHQDGAALWRSLKADSQLGVTRGTY